jgi:hypothetical protein
MALKKLRARPDFDDHGRMFAKGIRHREIGSGDTQILYARHPFARRIRNLRISDEGVPVRSAAFWIHGKCSQEGECIVGTLICERQEYPPAQRIKQRTYTVEAVSARRVTSVAAAASRPLGLAAAEASAPSFTLLLKTP